MSRVTSTTDEVRQLGEVVQQLISSEAGPASSGAGSFAASVRHPDDGNLSHAAVRGPITEAPLSLSSVSGDISLQSPSRSAVVRPSMQGVRAELSGAPAGPRGVSADAGWESRTLDLGATATPATPSAARWENTDRQTAKPRRFGIRGWRRGLRKCTAVAGSAASCKPGRILGRGGATLTVRSARSCVALARRCAMQVVATHRKNAAQSFSPGEMTVRGELLFPYNCCHHYAEASDELPRS